MLVAKSSALFHTLTANPDLLSIVLLVLAGFCASVLILLIALKQFATVTENEVRIRNQDKPLGHQPPHMPEF